MLLEIVELVIELAMGFAVARHAAAVGLANSHAATVSMLHNAPLFLASSHSLVVLGVVKYPPEFQAVAVVLVLLLSPLPLRRN